MKKLILLLLFIPLVSCDDSKKNKYKPEKSDETRNKYIHPLEKPYDSLANIFEENMYSKKTLIKIVEEYGPLSFRKENSNWYLYRFDDAVFYTGNRFKLFRIPVDSIYNINYTFDEKYEKFLKKDNQYQISYFKTLKNTFSAKGVNYDFKKEKYENYTLTDELNIIDFGYVRPRYSDTIKHINGSAIAYNTTKNIIKNIKIKVGIYTKMHNGKLISEDIYIIKDSLNSGEMKIVDISYKPKKGFRGKGITPMDFKIIDYEKY